MENCPTLCPAFSKIMQIPFSITRYLLKLGKFSYKSCKKAKNVLKCPLIYLNVLQSDFSNAVGHHEGFGHNDIKWLLTSCDDDRTNRIAVFYTLLFILSSTWFLFVITDYMNFLSGKNKFKILHFAWDRLTVLILRWVQNHPLNFILFLKSARTSLSSLDICLWIFRPIE